MSINFFIKLVYIFEMLIVNDPYIFLNTKLMMLKLIHL